MDKLVNVDLGELKKEIKKYSIELKKRFKEEEILFLNKKNNDIFNYINENSIFFVTNVFFLLEKEIRPGDNIIEKFNNLMDQFLIDLDFNDVFLGKINSLNMLNLLLKRIDSNTEINKINNIIICIEDIMEQKFFNHSINNIKLDPYVINENDFKSNMEKITVFIKDRINIFKDRLKEIKSDNSTKEYYEKKISFHENAIKEFSELKFNNNNRHVFFKIIGNELFFKKLFGDQIEESMIIVKKENNNIDILLNNFFNQENNLINFKENIILSREMGTISIEMGAKRINKRKSDLI